MGLEPLSLADSLSKTCLASPEPCAVFDLQSSDGDGGQISRNETYMAILSSRSSPSQKQHSNIDGERIHNHEAYMRWLLGDARHSSHEFFGFRWTFLTFDKRWRIVNGEQIQDILGHALDEVSMQLDMNSGLLDWTDTTSQISTSSHAKFICEIDWASTCLGPMSAWSPLLRSWCNLILAETRPAGIFWGSDSVMIYNEGFVEFAGEKHPALMGQHPRIQFAEVWDHFEGVLEHCRRTGESFEEDNKCLFLQRRGFAEECYVSFAFTPIMGPHGRVVGNYHTVHDNTNPIIAARRLSMLLCTTQATATAPTLKEFWSQLLSELENHESDVPYAVLYSVGLKHRSSISSVGSEQFREGLDYCALEGTIGVDFGAIPQDFDYNSDHSGYGPAFREALEKNTAIHMSTEADQFQLYLQKVERGFGDLNKSCIVCPLRPTKDKNIVGFLVLGRNTRRPYDEDYKVFMELFCRQLATSLASTVLYEEEIRRGRSAASQAALDRAELAATIRLRTEEIKVKEERFTSMTQKAPVGVFIQNASGRVLYQNQKILDLTPYSTTNQAAPTAGISINSEEWETVLRKKTAVLFETKLDTLWHSQVDFNGSSEPEFVWTLTSAYPEFGIDGTVDNVIGFVTDISQQKWAEKVQRSRLSSALEAKHQQEVFIDMTFHEIRNPLSAIMQCADSIITCLNDPAMKMPGASLDARLESCIEAAEIILSCSQHQKTVADDILTLSKLNAGLLQFSNVGCDTIKTIERGLKMFEAEITNSKITVKLDVHESIKQCSAENLEFDPSRFLQVFINLLSNAIKFTRYEKTREIKVVVEASIQWPEDQHKSVHYFPNKAGHGPNMFDKQRVYILVSISDTGCGLSEAEQQALFKRFSQASVKTHTKYGGSGLGLAVSKQLVELQGGRIGVTSQPGRGSTFQFFIATSRSTSDRPISSGVDAEASSTPKDLAVNVPSPQTSNPRVKSTADHTEASYEILLVEDNIVNQRVLAKQLRARNCLVHVANNGLEGLEHIQNMTPGSRSGSPTPFVILMDVEMPVMDGLTCMEEIRSLQRKHSHCPHYPIIATTANARTEQLDMATRAGADAAITKPFRVDDLLVKIDATIRETATKG